MDGTSNIILDVIQDGVDASNNAITFFTAASDNKNFEAHTSTTSSTTPIQTLIANATLTGTASTTRLNVVFGITTQVNPSWTWAPGATLNTTTGATVTSSPVTTTTYTVTATVTGCSNSNTVTVTVGSPLSVSVNSATICTGSSTGLTAVPVGGGAPYTFTWAPSTGLSATTGASVNASPTSTTTYTVTV